MAVAVAMVLAACDFHGSDSDHSQPSSSGGASSGGAAFDPDRRPPAAPIEGAVRGGTITVLATDDSAIWDPRALDPSNAYFLDVTSILSGLVTRSLTQYVYDPATGSMVLVPDLATDLGTPNSDFTSWTFTIRSGVRYENGEPVTAQDVAFGIKRSLDRTTFPAGGTYSNDYFLHGDTYGGAYTSGTDYPGLTVDGNTITIAMARPFPDMPYWAAYPAIGPIPQSGSAPGKGGGRYGRHPLATGPYMFGRYAPHRVLTLVRNPYWDPATDPGRHAYPNRYVIRPRSDAEQIDATFLGGSPQAATMVAGSPTRPQDFDEARRLGVLTSGQASCTTMGFPDYRTITDVRVRRAIAYAYPYKQAAALANRSASAIRQRVPTSGTPVLPPGFPGRQDYQVLDTPPGTTDPARARALLRQAGKQHFVLRWPYASDDPDSVRATNAMAKAFKAAGFRPVPFPTRSYFSDLTDPRGPFNLRFLGWCADWFSGTTWIPYLFQNPAHGSQAVANGNFAFFDEPAVDAEIQRIGSLPLGEQQDAWGALDETIATKYFPAFVTGYLRTGLLHGSRIGDMELDPIFSEPVWKDLYLQP